MFSTQKESNSNNLVKVNLMDLQHEEKIIKITKALSHPIRIAILRQLIVTPHTITELAELNNITNATVIFHLQILEDSTLIYSKVKPNKKGKTLMFFINFYNLHIFADYKDTSKTAMHTQSVGVGDYIEANFNKYMRIATNTESHIFENNDAFNSVRYSAQLLCADNGSFTYAFSNRFAKNNKIKRLEFSLEICSESPYYRNDWKSEISFAINGIEVATYLSPGDFGGIKGRLNPEWWNDKFTQYGLLVIIEITEDGVFLNGEKTSNCENINTLNIELNNKIDFSVYTKENSKYAGGFNLFGKGFGNYEQDIVMKALYADYDE